MTDFILTYRITTETQQKAVALRDKIGGAIAEDEDVVLAEQSMAQATTAFEVSYVDTKTSKPDSAMVEAIDSDAAKSQVEAATPNTVVVAKVSPVDPV